MVSKEIAVEKLLRQIEAIPELKRKRASSPEFKKWKRDTQVLIQKVFGEETRHIKDFNSISFSLAVITSRTTDSAWQEAYKTGMDHAEAILQSFIDEINDYWDDRLASTIPLATDMGIRWDLIHPKIVGVARTRFESNHYADAVEAAFKEVNSIVKVKVKAATGKEMDGANLMTTTFSPSNPIIKLDDLTTVSGKDIQTGYMQIFAGAMTGIRNPKAHGNINIDEKRAIHLLFLASLLLHKLDEAL